MHLAIEAVGVKHSGGAVVLLDVVRAALRCEAIGRITIFCSPRAVRKFSLDLSPSIAAVECAAAEAGLLQRIRWLLFGVEFKAKDADVLLCMSGIGSAPIPVAAFVQQSLPFSREAMRAAGFAARVRIGVIRALMKRSCRRASLVVAQTPAMSSCLQRSFGVEPSRVMVVRPFGDQMGMNEAEEGDPGAMLATPPHLRLLYVGNTSGYKNLGCLVDAMPAIRRRHAGATLFLSCAPDHPWCAREGIAGLGYLGGSSLAAAYRMATLFVTASLVESGNLTLVEAMAAGLPIVCADRPYARDLCGTAAVYFDPRSSTSAADAILATLADSAVRERMAAEGIAIARRERALRPYDQLMEQLAALAGQPVLKAAAR